MPWRNFFGVVRWNQMVFCVIFPTIHPHFISPKANYDF